MADELHLPYLALAVIPLAAFAVAVQRRIRSPWVLVPLAVLTWWLVHQSGVHATVAGVLLGFTVPVLAARARRPDNPAAQDQGLAEATVKMPYRPLSGQMRDCRPLPQRTRRGKYAERSVQGWSAAYCSRHRSINGTSSLSMKV